MIEVRELKYILEYLIEEMRLGKKVEMPKLISEKKKLIKDLMTIRYPLSSSEDFLEAQNVYLQKLIKEDLGILKLKDLNKVSENIYLHLGTVVNLDVDMVVNSAKRNLLGCFDLNHPCIDQEVHFYSGLQLRLAGEKIIERQNHLETFGDIKLTSAYNLPSSYIINAIAPMVGEKLEDSHRNLLKSCYKKSMEELVCKNCNSIAFSEISVDDGNFPKYEAAKIAVDTVISFIKSENLEKDIVFVVKDEETFSIYNDLIKEKVKN